MLPSKGYFSAIPCFFYLSGNCKRPHCHYRHCVRDKTNSGVEAADTSDSADEIQWFGSNLTVAHVTDMVEQAIDQALVENPQRAKTVNRKEIIRSALEQLRKQNRLKNSPELNTVSPMPVPSTSAGFPSYKPTPIAELNKRHIPVACAPEKPMVIRKEKRPEEKLPAGPSLVVPQASFPATDADSSQQPKLGSHEPQFSMSSLGGFVDPDMTNPPVQEISDFLGYERKTNPAAISKNSELDRTSSDLQCDDEATIDFIQSNYSGVICDTLTQLKNDASKERGEENSCEKAPLLNGGRVDEFEDTTVTSTDQHLFSDLCSGIEEREQEGVVDPLKNELGNVAGKVTCNKERSNASRSDISQPNKSNQHSESDIGDRVKKESHDSTRKKGSSSSRIQKSLEPSKKRHSSSMCKISKPEKCDKFCHKVKNDESEKNRIKTTSSSSKKRPSHSEISHSQPDCKKSLMEKVSGKGTEKNRDNSHKNQNSHNIDLKRKYSSKPIESMLARKGLSIVAKDGKGSSSHSSRDHKRKRDRNDREIKRMKLQEGSFKSSNILLSKDGENCGRRFSQNERSEAHKGHAKPIDSHVIPITEDSDGSVSEGGDRGICNPIIISSSTDSSCDDTKDLPVTIVGNTKKIPIRSPSPSDSVNEDSSMPVCDASEVAKWIKAKKIIQQTTQPKVRISSVPNVKNLLTAKTQLMAKSKASPKPALPVSVAKKDDEEEGPVAKVPRRKAHGQQGSLKRPIIMMSRDVKVNVIIRQQACERIFKELCQFLSHEEASSTAVAEEFKIAQKCTNPNSYRSCSSSLLLRIRRTGGDFNQVANSIPEHLTAASMPYYTFGWTLYKCFEKYLATEAQLRDHGYPMPLPGLPDCAYIDKEARHFSVVQPKEPFSRRCVNCRAIYEIDQDGMPTTSNDCNYHWGRIRNSGSRVNRSEKYSCCGGGIDSSPCEMNTYHVWSGKNEDCMPGFVKTPEFPKGMDETRAEVYILDCEMCYTTRGRELARLTVLDLNGYTVFDEVVAMEHKVLDYCTRFSGITEEKILNATHTFQDVRNWVLQNFNDKTILVGHSLENDLIALKIFHKRVVDTSILFPHNLGLPARNSLKILANTILREAIQESENGHDSKEDAFACLKLVLKKICQDSLVRKPRRVIGFGGNNV